MKIVYSNKSKKCIGIYNGTSGNFIKYEDDDGNEKEAHMKDVTIIGDQEGLNAFLRS